MVQEIGSEFWETETSQQANLMFESHHKYLLTGRTAIDFIIKDIKESRVFNIVYLPTYCCHTMIQPFLDNGIIVKFYDVKFCNGKYTYDVDFDTHCDAILIMQYFGFYNEDAGQIISRFKELGKLIIEDATHSWLSDAPYNNNSDYIFVSYRKWTGIPCGAVAIKIRSDFLVALSNEINHKYVQLRKEAATLKKEYIKNGFGNKDIFLGLFNEAESLLKEDYINYSIPEEIKDIIMRLDLNKIKHKRRDNAEYLIRHLQENSNIETIKLTNKDIPLFVPIVVQEGKRDNLRQHLINNDIYCPVHWPLSTEHKFNNKFLFENGLSLVCDQRYSNMDMNRVIETINSFYGG